MSDFSRNTVKLPLAQEAIRAKCFHPSGTFVEFPIEDVEISIPERFERIAHTFPQKIAVQGGENEWTYAQLNHLSNRIARMICSRLGSRGQPVALFLGDPVATVAAMLAVLKSANFYVVMDSSYPVERLRYMLEDSTAKVVLTDSKHRVRVNALGVGGIEMIEVDTIEADVSGEDLNLALKPLDYAFIVYTSGSTGYPKGVLHNHRSVLFSVFIETNGMRICREDQIGLIHSFSSSGSTKYTYAALLNGATLVTFDVQRWGVEGLSSWLIRESVTLCDFTASLFRTFACTLKNSGNFPLLRLIILGSEATTIEDVALFKRLFHPESILVILFATSETATIRNYFIERAGVSADDAVPVGYPVEGKSVSLVDEAGGVLGPGRIGEIAVKSRYLAVGYWRQPELTRAKFLPDPDHGAERTYLTGDMGQLNDDGCLFHLGRKDDRVNIRGYTVEPLEIERCLLEYPAVKAAAVVGRVSDSGEPILVGYCVPVLDADLRADALIRFLRASLPSHMVPAKLVMLERLPLTPNGKVDRQVLPDPGRCRPALESPYVSPRTDIEKALVDIWSEVLSVDSIGIHDNFFDLGGHSLAATRVVSRVISQFQLEIALQSLFQSPTVAEMAAVITDHQGKQVGKAELDRMLRELESLSDEEAERLLSEDHSKDRKN
jgi:amino acid adenylation domain-containing protein